MGLTWLLYELCKDSGRKADRLRKLFKPVLVRQGSTAAKESTSPYILLNAVHYLSMSFWELAAVLMPEVCLENTLGWYPLSAHFLLLEGQCSLRGSKTMKESKLFFRGLGKQTNGQKGKKEFYLNFLKKEMNYGLHLFEEDLWSLNE